ncbi:hypothetical protein FHX82_005167 [Amycolatopsis bartoniae]|uniref:Uncharacterized protein n=1 Tax=Amycolatopsis bartoniae TaxID=941986 RepID=A0A8H9IMN9_9PSEU|nr:hypothetical protein [Amycolatopsis bartoniae]MBB2938091.1 hypothetical protein [Amycolatopsis bartoniae]GHF32603.1 hypothetical protein GCM10017566_01480 [Amycolatopsis bartoniae]
MTSDLVSPRKRDEKPAQLSPEQAAAAAMVAEAQDGSPLDGERDGGEPRTAGP